MAGADPAASIVAAHKKIDDEYRRALMSPFSAVAVQYFEPGQTHRLGVSATGVAFDPAETMTDVIEMTLEAGAFRVSPVAGSTPPVILGKNAAGDVVVSPGKPLGARTTIDGRDVVALGRYFVAETDGRPVGQLMLTYEWSDWRNGVFWWIQSVFVEPQQRGSGVFSALFRHVHEQARKRPEVCGLRLYVDRANGRARSVYGHLGLHSTNYDVMETVFRGPASHRED